MAGWRFFGLCTGLAIGLALAGAAPQTAQAQTAPSTGVVKSAVLTIEPDRFFAQSLYGRRVASEIERASLELAAENRRIESELTEEEQRLTDLRQTLDAETFRQEAEEFDTRVQSIRRAQEAKHISLLRQREEAQITFLNAVRPVLTQMMQERGAAVIVERRSVVFSISSIDITDAAIARIDAVLGDGLESAAPGGGETPAPAPEGGAAD
ncbi:OmpH family outer membrane protein [Poseidonocella sedimentorum]|uniref:Chaperone for outer membrane proteins, Skp family n=1 Tax=Poseidonocella sedimentorum TaxID=871652 RepID=A0A1I6DEQ6_9RHOB|nr:OmpH family outer membrane protein [Poseidonocella sedimentorum]SFR03851.1 chaperone for outer membrane proteins, Skp family [Poseidonocella sedimentorum]